MALLHILVLDKKSTKTKTVIGNVSSLPSTTCIIGAQPRIIISMSPYLPLQAMPKSINIIMYIPAPDPPSRYHPERTVSYQLSTPEGLLFAKYLPFNRKCLGVSGRIGVGVTLGWDGQRAYISDRSHFVVCMCAEGIRERNTYRHLNSQSGHSSVAKLAGDESDI